MNRPQKQVAAASHNPVRKTRKLAPPRSRNAWDPNQRALSKQFTNTNVVTFLLGIGGFVFAFYTSMRNEDSTDSLLVAACCACNMIVLSLIGIIASCKVLRSVLTFVCFCVSWLVCVSYLLVVCCQHPCSYYCIRECGWLVLADNKEDPCVYWWELGWHTSWLHCWSRDRETKNRG